jgi:Response regulator receiver domain.
MSRIKILIVEDDPAQIDTWKKQITRNNALNNVDYSADYAKSHEKAVELIELNKYDAAIVDIRLQSSTGVNDVTTGGNDVRDLLLKSEIVLIAHVTGEPSAVDFGESKYKDLVRVFTKADTLTDEKSTHDEVLEWLGDKSKIIQAMQKVKENISSKMADLFYLSIWPRWDGWQATGDENEEFIPSSITRHITSHLYSTF